MERLPSKKPPLQCWISAAEFWSVHPVSRPVARSRSITSKKSGRKTKRRLSLILRLWLHGGVERAPAVLDGVTRPCFILKTMKRKLCFVKDSISTNVPYFWFTCAMFPLNVFHIKVIILLAPVFRRFWKSRFFFSVTRWPQVLFVSFYFLFLYLLAY